MTEPKAVRSRKIDPISGKYQLSFRTGKDVMDKLDALVNHYNPPGAGKFKSRTSIIVSLVEEHFEAVTQNNEAEAQ